MLTCSPSSSSAKELVQQLGVFCQRMSQARVTRRELLDQRLEQVGILLDHLLDLAEHGGVSDGFNVQCCPSGSSCSSATSRCSSCRLLVLSCSLRLLEEVPGRSRSGLNWSWGDGSGCRGGLLSHWCLRSSSSGGCTSLGLLAHLILYLFRDALEEYHQ